MAAKGKAEVAERADNAPAVPMDMRPVTPVLDWMSQSTAVEAARAAAEVQAAVVVAQRMPRDEGKATERMLRSCGHRGMAERAFYSYERGGKQIVGPTVALAREALRCWGNAQSGLIELRRAAGYSEMMAWAWDLETNVRESSVFIVLHLRERSEAKGGNVRLGEEDERDIYEHNTSMAARREREMIKRILPPWFMAAAEGECHKTLTGSPEEFRDRVQQCVTGFARLGVTFEDLEAYRGTPREGWGPIDLSILSVLWSEIGRGERTVTEVFPHREPGRKGSAASTLDAAKAKQGTPAAGDDTQHGSGETGESPGPGSPGATAPRGAAPPPPPDDDPEEAEAARQRNLRDLRALFVDAGLGGQARDATAGRMIMTRLALARAGLPDRPLASLDGLDAEQAAAVLAALTQFAENTKRDGGSLREAMRREIQAVQAERRQGDDG